MASYRVEERTVKAALYYVGTPKATIRTTADRFGVSRSAIHYGFLNVLPRVNKRLSDQVREKSKYNNLEKHRRGGEATRQKFRRLRQVR